MKTTEQVKVFGGTGPAKFKIKSEGLGSDVISNFRVRPEVHAKIREMAVENDISMADVVRQMIDFALEHA